MRATIRPVIIIDQGPYRFNIMVNGCDVTCVVRLG